MKHQRARRKFSNASLAAQLRADEICLQVEDHSVAKRSAIDFFQLRAQRDPHAQAARVAEQFVTQNRALMSLLDVRIEQQYDGRDVQLLIYAGSAVGAIPLISPTTARPDYGLVVQPRFAWSGIGPMLADMGWRVSPRPLRLPVLRRSERQVPIWVLSFMILVRLRALLDSLDRRFELVTEHRRAPRGRVEWTEYATKRFPAGAFLSVPCNYPELQDDRLLKGAVRHSIERQLQALESQKQYGAFVHRLIEFAHQLAHRVQDVAPYLASPRNFVGWLQRPMRGDRFMEGLQAIEWTIEERGLAGVSDLEGLPWTMPMDQFFEAWVETICAVVAQRIGAQLKVGRKRETVHPIRWDPPYLGSQKSLVPDILLEREDVTVIIDAKYKRHWEELHQHSWSNTEEQFREEHRNDLLQVLAYANLARTSKVIVCLVYPCSPDRWNSLQDRGRLVHRADLTIGVRSLHLWLTAVPMAVALERVACRFADELRPAV